MRLFLAILFITLVFSSCKKEEEPTLIINPCGINFETTVHYMALGDEFSSGLYIEADQAWSSQVAAYISDQGYFLSDFEQVGGNGSTTTELSDLLDSDPDAQCKNLITIMSGVHDQLTGRTAAQFQNDYNTLLGQAVSRAGSAGRVICVTIPDYSITPGLPPSAGTPSEANAEIVAFNGIIVEEAEAMGAYIADIYPISQSAYQFLYVPEDSLHADADHHNLWANIVSAEVSSSLD